MVGGLYEGGGIHERVRYFSYLSTGRSRMFAVFVKSKSTLYKQENSNYTTYSLVVTSFYTIKIY